MSWFLLFLLCVAVVALAITFVIHSRQTDKLGDEIDQLQNKVGAEEQRYRELHGKATQLNKLFQKYKPIHDVDRAISERKHRLRGMDSEIEKVLTEGRRRQSETIAAGKAAAAKTVEGARTKASGMVHDAQNQAEQIAGDALRVRDERQNNERLLKAIKNTIDGYGEEYLVPAQTILDELAEDWGHKEAGEQLKQARDKSREMVKAGESADCDYKEASRKATAIHFVIDAFNGKTEAILSKVKHDNYGKIHRQIEDAFAVTNKNGEAFRNARITPDYLEARLAELRWAVAVHELKLQEREEQRRIRETMREEERARKEFEKAQKAAEQEEKTLADAMKKAEAQLASAHAEDRKKIENELERLKRELAEAHERGTHAISMAQQTKQGHVYIISNIGSFGEEVLKIGVTRRLKPEDRVRELGDASVPFEFDIHAMIFSEDAPTLENSLHQRYDGCRVNKVNPRKEFFRIPLHELKESLDGEHDVHWTMHAEARAYRETKALERQREAD